MAELIKDPNLLALFHFDDNLTDAAEMTTMASLQGSTAYASGKFGKGLTMKGDGSTGWNIPNINFATSDFTLEFWFYGTEQPTKYAKFFESSRYDTAGGIAAEVNPNTTTCYVRQCGSDYANHQTSFSYSLNTWTHLAVVRNSGTITVYKNGVSVGSFSASNNLTATNMKIGASADTSNNVSVPCVIDELRISNSVRWSSAFTPPNAPYPVLIEKAGFYAWDVYNTKTVYAEQYTSGSGMSFDDTYETIYFGTSYTFSTSNGRFTVKNPSYAGRGYGRPDVLNARGYITNGSYASGTSSDPMIYNNNPFWTTEDNANWYIMNYDAGRKYTHTTSKGKGSINSSVSSTSSSAYPQDAISGSYWYTFRGAPSNISYPTNIEAGQAVQITWTAGTNPLYYRVERSTDGGSSWQVLSATVTGTSFTDTTIAGDTSSPSVMYRVCTLGEMAASDYSTGSEVNIPRCSVRIKINGAWVKGKATYRKENGAWVIIPMADEAAIFGAYTHRKVILLTSIGGRNEVS